MSEGVVRRQVTGTPQGGVLSPMLANVYLHQIDRVWDVREHGVLVRYADDVVIMCRSRAQAEDALAYLTGLLAELGLTPKASKTRIVHLTEAGEGLDFLGQGYSVDRTFAGQVALHGRSALGRSRLGGCPPEPGGLGVTFFGWELATRSR